MTSRRPMTRTYSANGRTSSFSEEDGNSSNGRAESRSSYLSNVRPENSYSRYSHYRPTRSTLCSVMAQLTEDIQPSFETTLKSKAVSESCNVKFSCVVSGHPAPELKWYKDDAEMDRYCGLPKYEIHRNGKTHTLHIYNCTLDDAAIYQASASNSKGIVSCSGVLEVGTMNEFQIHQRFFAKLKQKAEKKKKDMEEQTKKGKKNIPKEETLHSPERPPRKRPILSAQDRPVVKEPDVVEQVGAAAEPNGLATETTPGTSIDSSQEEETPQSVDILEKKKIKISNGLDIGVNSSSSSSSSRNHMMGNGGENCYDGGMSLTQFLSETLQSQAAEEKQNSSQVEQMKETDIVMDIKEEERMQKEKKEQGRAVDEEHERKMRASADEDSKIEKDNEREKTLEMLHTTAHGKHGSEVKHHSKAHKDHDQHHIQASISSMLHTVKDFLFGKSKKDSHDHTERKEREFDRDSVPQPQTPPSFRMQPQAIPDVHKPLPEDTAEDKHKETGEPEEPSESLDIVQQSVTLVAHKHKNKDSFPHTDLSPAPKLPPEHAEEAAGQKVKEADGPVEATQAPTGAESSSPGEQMSLSEQVFKEVELKDSQAVSVIEEVPGNQQESNCLEVSPQSDPQDARDKTSPREGIHVLSQTKAPYKEEPPLTSPTTKMEESWIPPPCVISVSDTHSLGQAPTPQEEPQTFDKVGEEGKPDSESCEEEKGEVKSSKEPCLDINRSEVTELTTPSLEERIEPCEYMTPDQVFSAPPHASEIDDAKEETSQIQETNEGVPPTAAQESLEEDDLQTQHKCTPALVVESVPVHNLSDFQSSSRGFRCSKKESDLKEMPRGPAFEKGSGSQENAILQGENTGARHEQLQFEVESEKRVKEVAISTIRTGTQTEGREANVFVKCSTVPHEDGTETQPGWPLVIIPQIHISTVEDTPDIKPDVPNVKQKEQFVIPKIEIMEPELKECSISELNKQESDDERVQCQDATCMSEVMIQDKILKEPPSSLPTQKGMQSDFNLSATEKVQEVSQPSAETKTFEQVQPHTKSTEQLPQMTNAPIPVINVSCIDDKENDVLVNALLNSMQPLETPMVPLFVVPPISVTCHESGPGLGLPPHGDWTETETSAVTQRGTMPAVGNNVTAKPEKKQSEKRNDTEEASNSPKESTHSLLGEALTPQNWNNVPSFNNLAEEKIVPESLKIKPPKEAKKETSVEDVQRYRSSVERLSSKPPAHPSLSPASLRKFMSKAPADSDSENVKVDEDLSGGSTPTSLSCENSPRMKRRDSLTLIRSATPEELASGARRKIFIPKMEGDAAAAGMLDAQGKKETPYMSPSQARRAALLQSPKGQNTPPMERRSPLLSRRKTTLEVPKVGEEPPKEETVSKKDEKTAEKKLDPLKAPQVIRKIRGEPFPDASGHLKLWCQFFNVLSDATIKWYRDEEEILEVKRSGGDESQVALAVVLASSQDCGVYGCTINNEYGTDTTDFLLSEDILAEILLREDLEVGEEIEMTPMLFAKGLVDCGSWGSKYFGRIMTETTHLGKGCAHKASRVKVIYGLDPVFDSGSNCIIKVQSPIAYGTKQESNLVEKNLEIIKQECKVQNMIREYCKIFAAEARVIENFGFSLEVIPQYLMYRPANSVPYATVEANLEGVFLNHCMMDPKGELIVRTVSEVEQKCSSFQHWIHQWTHGNLLVTRLEGVETRLTNVRVVTKSKGYQGLTEHGSPEVFEKFQTQHQCNYYCGLLGLRSLKTMDTLQQPSKVKGSRSPLLNRKLGSNSPQLLRKSPQTSRKTQSSPKVTRKVQGTEENKSDAKSKPATETVDALETR